MEWLFALDPGTASSRSGTRNGTELLRRFEEKKLNFSTSVMMRCESAISREKKGEIIKQCLPKNFLDDD